MRRQSAPYRIPPEPGYIGAYNWNALLAGLAVLFAFNIAATQWIADQFRYDVELGPPRFQTHNFFVYQPFAWSLWVLRYAGSTNLRIRFPVQVGVLIVGAGCLAALGIFFFLNMLRTRRLSKNSEDLHGSARWAHEEDILRTGLLDAH